MYRTSGEPNAMDVIVGQMQREQYRRAEQRSRVVPRGVMTREAAAVVRAVYEGMDSVGESSSAVKRWARGVIR